MPAIVQLKEGAATADHELVAVCEERIARYKVPKAVRSASAVLWIGRVQTICCIVQVLVDRSA